MGTSYKEECIDYKRKRTILDDGEYDTKAAKKKKKDKPKKSKHKHEYKNVIIKKDNQLHIVGICSICGKSAGKIVRDDFLNKWFQENREMGFVYLYWLPADVDSSTGKKILNELSPHCPVMDISGTDSKLFDKQYNLEDMNARAIF